MLNKSEFRKLVGDNKHVNIDGAYKLYKELNKKEHLDNAKKIAEMSDRELNFLRNTICSNHLIEMSPDEIKGLSKVLKLIVEHNEE